MSHAPVAHIVPRGGVGDKTSLGLSYLIEYNLEDFKFHKFVTLSGAKSLTALYMREFLASQAGSFLVGGEMLRASA